MKTFLKILYLHLLLVQISFAQINTAWIRTLDGPVNYRDEVHDIATDDSGNVFVTGGDIKGIGSIGDYMTAKYNSSGDLQWIKILDVFPHDDAQHIVIDHAGNVIVSGDGEGGYTTIKYSSSGDSLWTAILNAYNPFLISIAIDDSNNIYLAGTDDVQSVAVKYNSEGIVKWEKHYSGPNSETRTNNILIDDVGYIYCR
jgi:hypothetical protein